MKKYESQFTRLVTGLGSDIEDASGVPVLFRALPLLFPNPASPHPGTPPEVGRSISVTGSPYADQNPLPN